MLISHYLIFKSDYVVPNFSYGTLGYLTISTSSWYLSMVLFTEMNKDDDDDDDMIYLLTETG